MARDQPRRGKRLGSTVSWQSWSHRSRRMLITQTFVLIATSAAMVSNRSERPVSRPQTPPQRAPYLAKMEGEICVHEPFSLLIPVYDGDQPDYLRRAFR